MKLRDLVVVGSALAGGVFAQQQVLEVEPNDAPGTAQVIQPGDHVVCSFAATADEDWFAFTLAAPGQVHLRSVNAGTLSLSTTRDTRIALYDATGTQRLAWNDNASGTRADCGVTVPAGSYLWRVSLKTAITAPAVYDLDFFVLPGRPIDVPEGPEPNDPSQPGWAPTPMTLGQTVEGQLATPADIDWWAFTLPNRGYVQCVSFDDGGVPQLDNMALRFYHEATPGNWVPLGTGNATNSASHRVSSLTHTGLLSAGSYAVAVMAGTVATGTAPWDYVKAGRYSLRTTFVDMHGAAAIPEAPEPNSSAATAAFVTLGFDALGSAQAGNDPDWYAVAITGPTVVVAMAEGVGATPLPGSSLRLWDANGASVGSGSGGATTHGRLVATVVVPGIYYLEIAASQFAMTGDYLLHTGEGAPVYVQSTTRVEPASTNACVGSNALRPMIGFLPGETGVFDSTFVTRIERTIPNSFAAVMFGLSNTTALGGSVPLPAFLDWGGLDSQMQPTPCYVRVDPVVMILVLTDANGTGEFAWKYQWSAAHIGTKIFEQALCFDPSLNGFGLSVTNDASFVAGDLPF